MKKLFHLTAILFLVQLPLHAQYQVARSQASYASLTDAVSVSNSQIWNNEEFQVAIGFPFVLADSVYSSVSVSADGFLAFAGANRSFIRAFVADLKDRGTTTSASEIRTSLSGTAGDRIRKFEWSNAGFANGTANDFVNFQLWLHENNSKVTVHIGNWQIDTIASAFNGKTGPQTGLIYKSFHNSANYYGFVISGNPMQPNTHDIYGASTALYLNGVPAPGTRYVFYKPLVAAAPVEEAQSWSFFPNPTSQFLNIKTAEKNAEPFTVSLFNQQGQQVLTHSFDSSAQPQLDIRNLPTGIYLLQVVQGAAVQTSKISKL